MFHHSVLHRFVRFLLLAQSLYLLADADYASVCYGKTSFTPGSAVFGALFDIHDTASPGMCGAISESTLQEYVAMKWSLAKIQEKSNFIPDVSLGMIAHDSCASPFLAAKAALNVLPNQYLSSYSHCDITKSAKLFLGLAGPSRSGPAAAVADVAEDLNVVQIAYSTTLASFSNKTRYPNFFRTIPSDTFQSKVLVDIVKKLGWTQVAAINTDDNYGRDGIRKFKELAKADGICVTISREIPVDTNARNEKLLEALKALEATFKSMGSPSMGVIYFGQKTAAKSIMEALKDYNEDNRNLHWIMSDGVGKQGILNTPNGLGSLTVTPYHTEMTSFKNHWIDVLTNVSRGNNTSSNGLWMEEYMMKKFSCTIPKSGQDAFAAQFTKPCSQVTRVEINASFVQSQFLINAIDVIYIIAHALKEAHAKICVGSDYSRFCKKLEDMSHHEFSKFVQDVSFSYRGDFFRNAPKEFSDLDRKIKFDQNGDLEIQEGNVMYTIYSYQENGFVEVGTYKDNSLTLNTQRITMYDKNRNPLQSPNLPSSVCSIKCDFCMKEEDLKFAYIPGDVIIVGVFSLHERNDDFFTCGKFRNLTASVQAVEAFLYALDQIKVGGSLYSKFTDDLRGHNIGALILDDCYTALRASRIILDFMRGALKLTHNNTIIDPAKVVAVLGAFSSDVTIAISDILTQLNIPVVSYGSVSAILSNRDRYPYFSRTVPPIETQAHAMVELVKKLNWNYVSVIYVRNAYAISGFNFFKKYAIANRICIAVEIPMDINSDEGDMGDITERLQWHPAAKGVIIFADDFLVTKFLKAMQKTGIHGKFHLIGSDGWSNSLRVIQDVGGAAQGSLTFSYFNTSIPAFNEYFLGLNPTNNVRNPWYVEYWQDQFKCDIPGRVKSMYQRTCAKDLKLESFTLSAWTDKVIYAAYAIALGFSRVMNEHKYSKNFKIRKKPDLFTTKIRSANFSIKASRTSFPVVYPFDHNGEGNVSFIISSIQRISTKYSYVQIGHYDSSTKQLQLNVDDIKFYGDADPDRPEGKSSCRGDLCKKCEAFFPKEPLTLGGSTSGQYALIVICVILVLLLIAVSVLLFLQRRKTMDSTKALDASVHSSQMNNTLPRDQQRPLPMIPDELHHQRAISTSTTCTMISNNSQISQQPYLIPNSLSNQHPNNFLNNNSNILQGHHQSSASLASTRSRVQSDPCKECGNSSSGSLPVSAPRSNSLTYNLPHNSYENHIRDDPVYSYARNTNQMLQLEFPPEPVPVSYANLAFEEGLSGDGEVRFENPSSNETSYEGEVRGATNYSQNKGAPQADDSSCYV